IWGISREEISQAFSLVNKDVVVYAGMRKGLPLADPAQSQLRLLRGRINQSFGNWQGTTQTLNLVITADDGRAGDRLNFSFLWKANTPLDDMIRTVMAAALAKADVEVFISPDIKSDIDQPGFYSTLSEFCQALTQMTNTQK